MKAPGIAAVDEEADRYADTPHPRHATRLIGHEAAEHSLLDAYRQDRLPHALIIGGPKGVGKATLAWRLARFLLAFPDPTMESVREAHDLSVPGDSREAGQVSSLAHPNIVLLRRELNEKTKKFYTEIRAEAVRKTVGLFQRAPGANGHRIAIVDSAEDLNHHGANALLKLIEEPPPRSLFLLVAHRPGLILPTIRSRARLLRCSTLTPDEVAGVIRGLGLPWSDFPAPQVAGAAARAGGSVQEALRRLGHGRNDIDANVSDLLDGLPALNWPAVHRIADRIAGRDGDVDFEIVMSTVFAWLQTKVRSASDAGPSRLAAYAEVWENIAASARETEALNLDRRPLLLSIFPELAAAARAAAA